MSTLEITPEIKQIIRTEVLGIMREMISDSPDQMAILLNEHIKDVAVFRRETLERFDRMESHLDEMTTKIDEMITKDHLEENNKRLLTGIGELLKKIK